MYNKFIQYLRTYFLFVCNKLYVYKSAFFHTQVLKCGVVESCIAWAQAKSKVQLNKLKKGSGPKNSKLRGIAKLDDANNAGGKAAKDCTLIVTEGDSAKALAISGLSVVGRDSYGVFPLRGKLLNVRDASHKQVSMYICT